MVRSLSIWRTPRSRTDKTGEIAVLPMRTSLRSDVDCTLGRTPQDFLSCTVRFVISFLVFIFSFSLFILYLMPCARSSWPSRQFFLVHVNIPYCILSYDSYSEHWPICTENRLQYNKARAILQNRGLCFMLMKFHGENIKFCVKTPWDSIVEYSMEIP